MAQQGGVYDPEKEKDGEIKYHSPRPQLPPSDEALRDITGISKADEEAIDKAAIEHAEAAGRYDPGISQGGEAPLESTENLSNINDSEESGDDYNDGYARNFSSQPNQQQGNQKSFLGKFLKGRSVFLVVGGVGGGGIISMVIALFLLIPLKIESIIRNLESRFFSLPELSLDITGKRFFSDYVVHHVVPSYKNCGTTRNKDCHVTIYNPGTNPILNMYHAWAQDRLEQKLYTDYGISFEIRGDHRTYMVVDNVTKGAGVYVGQDADGLYTYLVGHSDLWAIISNAMQNETLSTKLLFRYKIGRLFKSKYGQPRCIFFCNTRGKINNTILGLKNAAKVAITQRVIVPYNQSLGIALECILTNCDATNTQPTDPSSAPEEYGFPENAETDTAIRVTLGDIGAQYGATAADFAQAQKLYDDISKQGYEHYLVSNGVAAITGDAAIGESVANAIPLIGWANLANNIYQDATKIGPALKKLRYLVIVPAAVDLYLTYRTETDEVHTGNVDPTALGSMTDSLGPGDNGNPNDPEEGGTSSAEQAPLYASINNDPSNYTGSLFSSLLPGDASAASPSGPPPSGTYLCNNGKPVPAGMTVCPEEVVGGGSPIANSVHTFLTTNHFVDGIFFPGSEIKVVADIWSGTVGWIINLVGSLIGDFLSVAGSALNNACNVPGATLSVSPISAYCNGKAIISKAIPLIFDAFVKAVIPSPISTNMSGGRNYEVAAIGADAGASEYSQEGLGGQEVSEAQANSMYNQEQSQAQVVFQHESFFARLFDTSTSLSLVSKLAMSTPLNLQTSADSSFASIVSDPLSWLSSGFSSLFSGGNSASAATWAQDPFDIPQYAVKIPSGDLVSYWDNHCSDNEAQAFESDADYNSPPGQNGRIGNWDQEAANTVDPVNGMPENTSSNPCLLLKTATGIDGGLWDSSLLTSDDLADLNSSSSTTSLSPDCTSSTATGDAKLLCEAEQFNGVYYEWGGGHNGIKAFQAACPDPTNPPNNQPHGGPVNGDPAGLSGNPSPCAVDCSGLVSIAASEAFGQNFSWSVSTLESDSADWQSININSVQPGDVVVVGTDHVAIVDHYDQSSDTLYTFEAHETGDKTGPFSYPHFGNFTGAYRYIGPGSGS